MGTYEGKSLNYPSCVSVTLAINCIVGVLKLEIWGCPLSSMRRSVYKPWCGVSSDNCLYDIKWYYSIEKKKSQIANIYF